MNITKNIARHIREIHFGDNWSDVYMQDVLKDVSWQEATDTSLPCNSIAVLVFHTNFYLNAVCERVKGNNDFKFKHEDTFNVSPITSEADWQALLEKIWTDAEAFALAIEQFPEERLAEQNPPNLGSVYKKIHGVIEHNHYHLGQIVLMKKLLQSKK